MDRVIAESKEKKKKGVRFYYLTAKQFKKYSKDEECTILGSTRLREYCEGDDCSYFTLEGKNFILENKRFYREPKYYIILSKNLFVEVYSRVVPILILLTLLVGVLLLGIFNLKDGGVHVGNRSIVLDDSQGDSKDSTNNYSKESQESIIIPGFTKCKVSSEARYIKLMNPIVNDVYFTYIITELESSEVVETFTGENALSSASSYISDNKKTYYTDKVDDFSFGCFSSDTKERTDVYESYSLLDNGDNSYSVVYAKSRVLYCTGAIKPNKMVDWDAYSTLSSSGERVLQFRILTNDIGDLHATSGSVVDVNIVVE